MNTDWTCPHCGRVFDDINFCPSDDCPGVTKEKTMNQPNNTHDAMQRVIELMSAVMHDIERYADNPGDYTPEYFLDVNAAAGDAMLLAVWVRDQLKGEKQ